jgi:hypothetical protein
MVNTCTHDVDTGFAALGYAEVSALGVLQGITELLPISSTAHIVWSLPLWAGRTQVRPFPLPCSLQHWLLW